jgi:CBS domain containing-hemolysin-like protein
VAEFNKRLDPVLPNDGLGPQTVAAFIAGGLKRQPKPGDEFAHGGYRFRVDDLQDTLVSQLTVTKVPSPEGTSEDDEALSEPKS